MKSVREGATPDVALGHDELLGVPQGASLQQIKRAYYKLAKSIHPDKVEAGRRVEAEARFKKVAEAHATLSHPTSRREYDRLLSGKNWLTLSLELSTWLMLMLQL